MAKQLLWFLIDCGNHDDELDCVDAVSKGGQGIKEGYALEISIMYTNSFVCTKKCIL